MTFFTALTAITLVMGAAASPTPRDSYDYVIIGGGTAGTALATRLSLGLPDANILLLEAGEAAPNELRINVPGMRGSILGTNYDWNFTTIPQETLGGREIGVNRGKVLGGSSAMNYLCYDRAAAAEYDAWGDLGSPGWSWDVMIDAMTKSENFTGHDRDLHGHSGPIHSTINRIVYDLLHTWEPTVSQFGVPINEKSLAGDPIGVMFQPTNIDPTHYNRSYSANSYLPLAKGNLVVKTGVQVTRIEFDNTGDKLLATGVTLSDGTTILASKEVILSAGAIQSPGLLELSGVGQPEVLDAAGIDLVLELPGVGENYQDHIRTSNTYRLKAGYDSYDPMIYDTTGAEATEELQKWINGEVSKYDYTSIAYGFVNWSQISTELQSEMAQLAEEAVGSSSSVVDSKKIEYLSNPTIPDVELIMEANYLGASGYPGGNYFTIFTSVMHPLSRGSVHINASDPLGKPVIDPKYLSYEYDVRAVIEASKFARAIANTEPMKSLWEVETDPGADVQTEDEWRAFALDAVNTFYHPSGTCALLPEADGGVVDADLVVYGTSNLRVVDNSIIPVIPSGHIQTTAYGIAEVAAGKIIAAAS
ncbi:hypothetical protein BX600DRAFT_555884 [Xylariales sp. PMI_506]|nr:hypothetical protein BX600DRAFT_555884 [Xylariales sp. PMI_506]